jgi:hypothetical protein
VAHAGRDGFDDVEDRNPATPFPGKVDGELKGIGRIPAEVRGIEEFLDFGDRLLPRLRDRPPRPKETRIPKTAFRLVLSPLAAGPEFYMARLSKTRRLLRSDRGRAP